MIPFRPCYNIHFIDREYRLIHSTQKEMLNFNKDAIIGFPLVEFLPPSEAYPAMRAIDQAFSTRLPICHCYSFRDLAFMLLIDQVEDDVVAVHEIFDNPADRPRLKKFLWAASGNFFKNFNNKLKSI